MKKTLAIMLVLIMVLAMAPAFAEGDVAQIGETKYETLDEAITAAKDGETIELLADCVTSSGITVENKSLTIKSTGETKRKITLNDLGIIKRRKS